MFRRILFQHWNNTMQLSRTSTVRLGKTSTARLSRTSTARLPRTSAMRLGRTSTLQLSRSATMQLNITGTAYNWIEPVVYDILSRIGNCNRIDIWTCYFGLLYSVQTEVLGLESTLSILTLCSNSMCRSVSVASLSIFDHEHYDEATG